MAASRRIGATQEQFSSKMAQVRRRLTRMPEVLKQEMDREYQALAAEMVSLLRQTTPGETLPEGWEVIKGNERGVDVSYLVINTDPRANSPARSSTRTLLDILEFGYDGPYLIEPRPENPHGWLIWEEPKDSGNWVYARSVMHPGQEPMGFIAAAREQAKALQPLISRRLAKRAKQSFVKG